MEPASVRCRKEAELLSPPPFPTYQENRWIQCTGTGSLKVHKIENFFGSEFEFYTISLLVMLKY